MFCFFNGFDGVFEVHSPLAEKRQQGALKEGEGETRRTFLLFFFFFELHLLRSARSTNGLCAFIYTWAFCCMFFCVTPLEDLAHFFQLPARGGVKKKVT
jgi:hypothetical protein